MKDNATNSSPDEEELNNSIIDNSTIFIADMNNTSENLSNTTIDNTTSGDQGLVGEFLPIPNATNSISVIDNEIKSSIERNNCAQKGKKCNTTFFCCEGLSCNEDTATCELEMNVFTDPPTFFTSFFVHSPTATTMPTLNPMIYIPSPESPSEELIDEYGQ